MLTHRESYLRKMGLPDKSYSLAELSKISGLPLSALQDIFNRGVGAWKNNLSSVRIKGTFQKNPDTARFPRSARLPKEQWAMARVFSFLDRGKTYKTADSDIARRYNY